MKYLLILLPSLAFANFVKEGGDVTYAKKEKCEKVEGETCYAKPADFEVMSLQDVDVDDLSKPIYEARELGDVQRTDENGEPVLDEEGNPIIDKVCTFELIDEACVQLVGYKQKKEKQFVLDPAKVAAKEAKEAEKLAKENECKQFKTLLDDALINAQTTAADVQEIVRRLLGYHKKCR